MANKRPPTPVPSEEKSAAPQHKDATTLKAAKAKAATAAASAKTRLVETGKQAADSGAKATRTVTNRTRSGVMIIRDHFAGQDAEPREYVVVSELPEELKLRYLETLVWLTYQDDCEIDEREVCELQILLTQVECGVESRRVVRDRIADPTGLDSKALIESLGELAPDETRKAVGYSLIKDAIRLDHAVSDRNGPRRHQGGVRELTNLLDISEKQVGVIQEVCDLDREILHGELSDKQMLTIAKDLASKASGVGVPIAAVYLTGSVTGLSAAGITSGLATLGFGGVLGLSSMVTGIGTVVVGGVVAYQGMRWLMNRTSRDKAHRRELMLQEVLLIHQKAIANLAEDIRHFSDRLVALAADVETNRATIELLSREMTLLGDALGRLRHREREYEQRLDRANASADASAPQTVVADRGR